MFPRNTELVTPTVFLAWVRGAVRSQSKWPLCFRSTPWRCRVPGWWRVHMPHLDVPLLVGKFPVATAAYREKLDLLQCPGGFRSWQIEVLCAVIVCCDVSAFNGSDSISIMARTYYLHWLQCNNIYCVSMENNPLLAFISWVRNSACMQLPFSSVLFHVGHIF